MTRYKTPDELRKRLAIRQAKDADPSLTWDALAGSFGTSKQTVGEALSRSVECWKDEIDKASASIPMPAIQLPAMPPVTLVPRTYQTSAADASIARNTLLVLPTGLGKTVVALLHVQAMLGSMQSGICVVMAPTKALLVQHRDLFVAHLGMADAGLAIVDGETAPGDRKEFYKGLAGRKAVLFMTPRTVLNDIEQGRLPRERVVDLVVDEAHHATRGDPYALVYAHLRERGVSPRVLAMTASPGETEARIVEVCRDLGIDPADAIIKTREDADVRAHVFRLDVTRHAVDLSPEYERVRGLLVAVLREPCAWLRAAGLAGEKAAVGEDSLSLPSWESLQALADKHLAGAPARAVGRGDVDVRARGDVVSRLVLALRARHAVELVETQGFAALLAYHEKLAGRAAEAPAGSLLALLGHPQYKAAVGMAGRLAGEGSPKARHPKLDVLGTIVGDFVATHPRSRCIVFTKYRASIPMIVSHLAGVPGVLARRFVGQGDVSAADKGMDRETQQAVLRAFKGGAFNVLVATRAAEEGIDVADCDLVAFYEATASVIQFVQRQGRAGWRRDGAVAILLANGTADQLNAAALDTKLAAMPGIYYRVQRARAPGVPATRPAVETRRAPRAPRVPGTPRVSRPSAAPRPVLVSPNCLLGRELLAALAARGVATRVDGSIAGNVELPDGRGVRVITTGDAACWDVELTREELPGVARAVVAVYLDGSDPREGAILSRLEKGLEGSGIETWAFACAAELATLIAS